MCYTYINDYYCKGSDSIERSNRKEERSRPSYYPIKSTKSFKCLKYIDGSGNQG